MLRIWHNLFSNTQLVNCETNDHRGKNTQFALREKTICCAETAVKINLENKTKQKNKNDLFGSVGVNLKVTTQSNEH